MPRAATRFQRQLLNWYDRHRRDLPWRYPAGKRPDPYVVLVSELMLQQTQVVTVIPYFLRFMESFPTLAHLARASEQQVLCLWQGLGYYSRARNLQAAAQRVMTAHEGIIPRDLPNLLSLPGVGRYTAGAIASIAFDEPAPILDGNVARVLCRLEKIESDPRLPATLRELWKKSKDIVPADRPGDFNSALMELGATVCTPRNPRCAVCPVQKNCRARIAGVQDQIPLPRQLRVTPLVERCTLVIRHRDHLLIEQRPATGRWASLWQFVTVPRPQANPTPAIFSAAAGIEVSEIKPLGQVKHALTHRRYIFTAFSCVAKKFYLPGNQRRWIRPDELVRYPLPRPQLLIAKLLTDQLQSGAA